MKTKLKILIGVLSTLFLAVGLVRAAEQLDSNLHSQMGKDSKRTSDIPLFGGPCVGGGR
jgi:capsular polysaccharide biosynthesis protein